jgi:hypothetical protein
MKPFSVHIEDAVLDDLRRRLAATRRPDEPPGAGWEQGAPLAHVRALRTAVLADSVRRFAAS